MAYEVTRDMPMHEVDIETPLEKMTARLIDGKKLVFVPILRAGTGLLDFTPDMIVSGINLGATRGDDSRK